ncbi:MAG: ECF transporter S component [Oscillospiraceae bacterium]|jgi:riboflavin transporter FmnP|nr:ECF transporter S component [Oscillospiraceae bacterium]
MTQTRKSPDAGRLTRIAMMAAISTVLSFYPEIPLAFFAPWLKIDFSFVPILLTGYALGFWPGVIVLLIKNAFKLLQTTSAGVGEVADILVACALLLPAVLAYRRKRTRGRALIGMVIGIVCMTAVGVMANQWILLPLYLGEALPRWSAENPAYLWAAAAPFNLLKGIVICGVTYALYKPLSRFLKNGLKG